MLQKLLLIACMPFILVGCGTVLTKTPSAPAGFVYPEFKQPNATKVVLIVLENTNPDHARAEPFFKSLVASGAYLSEYYAVAHPSQPNYVALISGSTQSVDGDSPATLDRPFLGDEEHKLDWKVYAEGYAEDEPSGDCDLRPTIEKSSYVRRHVPHLNFQYVQENKSFCRDHVTSIDKFFVAAEAHRLPSFSIVIPNLEHDAHGTLKDVLFSPHAKLLGAADDWLNEKLGPLIKDPEFKRDVLLIVTFDENDTTPSLYARDEDNKVFTVLWGNDVLAGHKEHTLTHNSLSIFRRFRDRPESMIRQLISITPAAN